MIKGHYLDYERACNVKTSQMPFDNKLKFDQGIVTTIGSYQKETLGGI